jgi:hypothetical protein
MNNKTKILTITLFLFSAIASAQKAKDQVEINPIIRYDAFPEFTYGNPIVHYLKMKGLSWGINTNYKKAFAHHYYLKLGIGYYKYTFSKLYSHGAGFIKGNERPVNYPSTLWITFGTDKYWYNTISGNIGLERWFALSKNLKIISGVNWNHYFTYSKHYDITYGSYGSTISTNYVVPQKRYFGYSVNLIAGIQKQLKSFSIGTSIIIPIYDRWKKDEKFGENENEGRNKWFNGIGLGVTLSKELNF